MRIWYSDPPWYSNPPELCDRNWKGVGQERTSAEFNAGARAAGMPAPRVSSGGMRS